MAYSSKFVVDIVVGGAIQKERSDGTVLIPLGSEYGIRLQNKNEVRAKASLWIDEVHQGDFVVDAKKTVIILRSVSEDRAFKLVASQSQEAKDARKNNLPKGDSGLIRVRFYKEKKVERPVVPYIPYPKPEPYPIYPKPDKPWKPIPWRPSNPRPWEPYYPSPTYPDYPNYPQVWCSASAEGGVTHGTYGGMNSVGQTSIKFTSDQGVLRQCSSSRSSVPEIESVTVRGEATGQDFVSVYYEFETEYVEIRLKLLGFEPERPPQRENHCPKDGRKRGNDRYCGKCGHKFKD